jgi:CubicO group peptidase (beta-lactamase class C family)
MFIPRQTKRLFLLLLLIISGYAFSFVWRGFPLISGFGAKVLCSCVMVAGRDPDDVIKNELGAGLISLGSFSMNYQDSSATGSFFGLAKQKAIYRKGLGCSLVVEMSEEDFRSQKIELAQQPPQLSASITWPMGDKIGHSHRPGVDYQKLNLAIDQAFAEPGANKLRRTRAVVVVYDGELIAEKYANGFDKHSRHINWSMTKSLTNALVGILVKQGKLKIDDVTPVPDWKMDGRNKITLSDLLHMSSGLDWDENYYAPSDVGNMLFKNKNMGGYAESVPAKDEPGKIFYYSSGATNIISKVLRETIGDKNYYRFPYEALFYKLGMRSIVIEPDASGTFVGSSYSFATARDMARFGLLYANDGIWQGERLLPEGWVKYSTTSTLGAKMGEYGAHFWLNAGEPGNPSNRTYPSLPVDLFWADGFEGQKTFILPSEKLVIVKFSLTQGNYLDDNKFLADIVATLPNKKSQ